VGEGLFSMVNNWFRKEKDERIGQCWIEEVLPMYHDRAKTTNKTLWIIKSFLSSDIAQVYQYGHSGYTRHVDIVNKQFLTQNDVPVQFIRKGKHLFRDTSYIKEGYQEGQILSFERLGFLGDKEAVKKVFCVTDQYVLLHSMDSDTLFKHSYEELKILAPQIK